MDEQEANAFLRSEQVEGTVQCFHCGFWGSMVGYIEVDNRKVIQFVCPKCSSIEEVNNIWNV